MYSMPLTQKAVLTLEKFSIHQGDLRIPTYITTDKKIDVQLMNEAINIEIQRNDCLRLFYKKKLGKIYDYFVPELDKIDFPLEDFSNRTDEEMDAWLRTEASKKLDYLKGKTYRIYQFVTPEKKHGVYLIVSHANMDLYAIFAFYKDLIEVYDALEQNTEMPKPMGSYEEVIKKQLELESATSSKPANDLKFFENSFREAGASFYAGIDCMKQLNETRRKKKNPNARYIDISPSDLFNDQSETKVFHIDKATTDRMMEFCYDKRVSLQNLLYLGMRTYLSSVNEMTDDVTFFFLANRRSNAMEKRCGGSCVTVVPLRTIIKKETSFSDALSIAKRDTFGVLRHLDAPPMKLFLLIDKIEKRRKGATTASMMFTVCSSHVLTSPKGWNLDFGTVGTGYFPFIAYAIVLPSPKDGGLNIHYEYRTRRFTDDNIENLHNGTMNVIDSGINNPDQTISELLKMLNK